MFVVISNPSAMDAKVMPIKSDDRSTLSSVVPRRYSKTQRKINLYPFQVVNDTNNTVMDQGYLVLDVRTGKLVVEHRLEEVPVTPAEAPKK